MLHLIYFYLLHLMQNHHAQQSWDEMGEFDLPAMINKVLETTREEQLVYIGHSMGATGFLAMAAFKPQMQSKILQANLLAPAAFMEHIRSPVRIIAPYANEIKVYLKTNLMET